MSQHSSLRIDSVGAKHRNVLSRLERIKKLQAQGKWKGRESAYGLPKIKSMKVKVKKSVGGPEKEGAEGQPAVAAPGGKAAAPAKGAAPAKAAAPAAPAAKPKK